MNTAVQRLVCAALLGGLGIGSIMAASPGRCEPEAPAGSNPPEVQLFVNTSSYLGDRDTPELVGVALRDFEHGDIGSVSLSLRVAGRAVAPSAAPVTREVGIGSAPGRNPVRERLLLFHVDLSSVTIYNGERVEYTVTVSPSLPSVGWSAFSISATTTMLSGTAAAASGSAAVEACVCAFLTDLGLSKDEGIWSIGAGLNCVTIDDELATLRTCLEAALGPGEEVGTRSFTCTIGGSPAKVIVNIQPNGANGDSASVTSSDNDVVLAIGGNADSQSSSAGGDASAVNNKDGGVALAFAGKGGGASSGGNGGKATAKVSGSSAGDALAVGGDGGDASATGGDGGAGNASTGNSSSTASAKGGDGGDPANDNTQTGGNGGNAAACRGGSSFNTFGSGQLDNGGEPVNPPGEGEHGGGASAQSSGSGPPDGGDGEPKENQ